MSATGIAGPIARVGRTGCGRCGRLLAVMPALGWLVTRVLPGTAPDAADLAVVARAADHRTSR